MFAPVMSGATYRDAKMTSLLEPADFESIFEKMPGLTLILDPAFKIVAQNDAHARATLTNRQETLGRFVFDVFPDSPNSTSGISELRQSLLNVMKTTKTDVIANLKFDIAPSEGGAFVPRYWRVVNTPILDKDGFVRLIINRVDDLTVVLE
jgi:PAS domain-containing protein